MIDLDPAAATDAAKASNDPDDSPSLSQSSPGRQSPVSSERPVKHRRKTSNLGRLVKELSENRVGLEFDQSSRRFTNAKRYQNRPFNRDSTSSFDNFSPSQTRSVTPETSQTPTTATPKDQEPKEVKEATPAAKPKKPSETEHKPNKNIKPQPQPAMSRRDRGGRNARNNGTAVNSDSGGEEVALWEAIKKDISDFVKGFQQESEGLQRLCDLDREAGAKDPEKVTRSVVNEMDKLCRAGVKISDANVAKAKEIIERLNILGGLVAANEKTEEKLPAKRGSQRDAAAAAAMYDFDGQGDSPLPSPLGAGTTRSKTGDRASTRDRDRDRDRDSIGPKAGSVEPSAAGTPAPSGGANPARSKVVFAKGESVAFKPKVNNGEAGSDWILGEVAHVVGEGKSRRYKVLDIEPDDQSKQKEYKTSASSMIPITPESQAAGLPDWEPHTTVLALYPNTTTFYKAEVDSMDEKGRVNLKFEGEQDNSTLQQVERRFVIEFRA